MNIMQLRTMLKLFEGWKTIKKLYCNRTFWCEKKRLEVNTFWEFSCYCCCSCCVSDDFSREKCVKWIRNIEIHFQFNRFAFSMAILLKSAGIVLTIYVEEKRALMSRKVIDVNRHSFKAKAVFVIIFPIYLSMKNAQIVKESSLCNVYKKKEKKMRVEKMR